MSDDYLGHEPPPSVSLTEYERDIQEMEARYDVLSEICHLCEDHRSRYEAALRKIAEWQGYHPRGTFNTSEGEPVIIQSRYEEGANDMLATLKQIVEEALSS